MNVMKYLNIQNVRKLHLKIDHDLIRAYLMLAIENGGKLQGTVTKMKKYEKEHWDLCKRVEAAE
jgi:hypothetical protein